MNRINKKILCALLSLVLLSSMYPLAAFDEIGALEAVPLSVTDGYEVYVSAEGGAFLGSYDTLAEACAAVNHDGSGTDYTILVTADDAAMGPAATIDAGKTVTLTSAAGHIITQTNSAARHLTVKGGLILDNITLNGSGKGGGVSVSGGALTMHDGAAITRCSSSDTGSGISLINSTFTMNGGEISDNHQSTTFGASGGGVYMDGGAFTMHDGLITGNSSVWGGGVEVGEKSTFTMYGGEISHNRATVESGGGVHVSARGTFIMNGGIISGNQAKRGGGVFVGQGSYVGGDPHDWCKLIINDGSIERNQGTNSGGGVAARWNGLIEMNGGSIAHNTAPSGGGVSLTYPLDGAGSVSFTMRAGELYDNTATGGAAAGEGGGIYAYDDGARDPNTIRIMIGDSAGASAAAPRIYGNLAGVDSTDISGLGGGIFLQGPRVYADIYGGNIEGNTALCGGGAYLHADSRLTIADATRFTDNHAATEGGAIYTEAYTGYNGDIPGDYSAVQAGDYSSITSSADTIFSGNTASAAYEPPDDADAIFSNIGYAQSSVFANARYLNPLNNFDVNYAAGLDDSFPGLEGPEGPKESEPPETPELPETPEVPEANHIAYVIGYPDGTVGPENHITRAETATLFFRLIAKESRAAMWSGTNNFSDVMPEKWYHNAISTLANAGILSGHPDGSFIPDGPVSRAEFATIAVKLNMGTQTDGGDDSFSDISGHWAENEIALASRLGYVSGYDDGTFRPDSPISRAEAMAFLNNMLGRHVEASEDMAGGMVIWPDNMATDQWYYFAVQEATNSHTYRRKNQGIREIWMKLLDMPDWAALERVGAGPDDIAG